MRWYLVQTKPRQEQRAQTNLLRQGYDAYLPMLDVERLQGRQMVTRREPLFSRYMFVRLDDSQSAPSWAPIRSTLGVTRLVAFGNNLPVSVDDELIEIIKQREGKIPRRDRFSPGQLVVITKGPFAGVEAVYKMNDGSHRAVVLLEMLSKQVSVPVEAAYLRKV